MCDWYPAHFCLAEQGFKSNILCSGNSMLILGPCLQRLSYVSGVMVAVVNAKEGSLGARLSCFCVDEQFSNRH